MRRRFVVANQVALILQHLHAVQAEREKRLADGSLGAAVLAIKAHQSRRFAFTYADLLVQPRYAPATRFFLDELYGPEDFAERDRQFARVVPALVRLFPAGLVQTVLKLGALHALSEQLDTAMGDASRGGFLDEARYQTAWRSVGTPARREAQIALMVEIGADLDRFTRKPLLRQSLRLMRGPAAAAGLNDLQAFLESGFDSFLHMRGAGEFLALIAARERHLAATLFAPSHIS